MNRSILHCDMNNFYASVECMLDPSLRKYPVAVCGSVEERHGIVLAKNYAAKSFDVKTGDAVWQAKQKCKDLVVVPPHYEEYIKYSKLARNVYSRYTDQVEPYGINGTESDYKSYSDISGGMLLSSLCNLARVIDDPKTEKEPFELIIRWCQKFIHPYFVDDVNTLARDPNFTPAEMAMVLKKEATFSISKFMDDLNRLYYASRFYAAIDAACMGQEELILDICKAGRYFDPIAYFDKYRYAPTEQLEADYSSAGGDLLQEMMFDAKNQGQPLDDDIIRTPYDDYDELRAKLVDLIPSFQMRPKLNAKSNRYVFSADVHSIFDICWYTFARMVVDDAPPEKKTEKKEYTGVVAVCINCGRYFYRKRGNQMYCRRQECQSARKAKNQKDKRARDRLDKANKSK